MPERIARVRLPDGRIARVKVPEGTTPEQAMTFARQEAERHDKKPTSFWRGVYDGFHEVAQNVDRVASSVNPLMLAADALGLVDSDGTREKVDRRFQRDQVKAKTRGSTAGQITGGLVATAPALLMPGGPVVQGATSAGLMTKERTPLGVAKDMAIGGVTGKVADVGLRAAGRVVAPLARKVAEPIADVATRLGVRPTPASIGGNVAGGVQTGLGLIPGAGGVVGNAINSEVDDLGAAAMRTARQIGPVSTPQGAGEALAQGANKFSQQTKKAGEALYQSRDALIGGKDAPVLLGSAAKEIRDFSAQFPNTPALGAIMEHPAVRKLAAALPDGSAPELTLSEATDALSHIRGAVRNAQRSNTLTDAVKARIGQFEQAIENDVMRAAQASDAIAGRTGTGTAMAAQTRADRFWAIKKATERGPLKKALASYGDDAAVSGESVYKAMVADMSRTGGNVKRLRRAWGAMPEDARSTFAATAFEELGRPKPGASSIIPQSIKDAVGITDDVAEGGGWSFNTFHTNYTAMSPEARKLVFGNKGVDQQIDDIARYSARLKELDRTRNFSNTARATLAGAYVTIVGTQLMGGDVEGAGKSLIAIPAAALAGKAFMSSSAGRLWLRNSLKAVVEKGGTTSGEATLRKLTNQLPVIAESNPVIREEAMGLFRTLSDRASNAVSQSPGRVAATGQDEGDGGRKPPQQ